MSADGSVTRWFRELEKGNEVAAAELWSHFFGRIVRLANRRLGALPRRARDEEDVALSAFKSLCRGIQHGRFPALGNREDLWRLLIVITSRKAQDQFAYENRLKRTPSDGQSRLLDDDELVDTAISREPSPEFAAQMAETVDRMIDRLGHEDLQQIAIMKLEGHTNVEIAEKLNRGLATIERKLRTIRTVWEDPV